MLIQLRLDEVLGQETLAYDVYDCSGEMLCRAGQPVEFRKLKRKAEKGLFRQQDKLPIEWIMEEENLTTISTAERQLILSTEEETLEAEMTLPYLIEREEAVPYLKSMFYFWKKLEKGEEADIALLEVMEHQLVADVIGRMEQLQYLNQLRIRDKYTYSHTLDVTVMSIALGVKLGLGRKDLEVLALGALLHDLGKIFIPKPIMFKPGRLTNSEFDVMKMHPEIGYRILTEQLKLPQEVARPALEHQELWAGGGYPLNLKGNEIHFFSQIVKIADVYDALTSQRPYKEAIPSRKAIKIMLLEGAQSFNPIMLKAFLELSNYPEGVPVELEGY